MYKELYHYQLQALDLSQTILHHGVSLFDLSGVSVRDDCDETKQSIEWQARRGKGCSIADIRSSPSFMRWSMWDGF